MDLSLQKFGVGQPVPRTEDPVLVQGRGRYTDDLNLPGQAYAYIVRSPFAHGVIRSVGTDDAAASPGVLGVWTGRDLDEAGYGPLKCAIPLKNKDGSDMRRPTRHAFATDKVRWVGDPVAVVVAESAAQAKDAAELIELDIEPLPAVTTAREGAQSGAPVLYDEVPRNLVLDYHYGDSAAVERAFAEAACRVKLELLNNRVVVSAMEPRAAIGEFQSGDGRWVLHVGSQGVFGLRNGMAEMLGKRSAVP